MSRSRSRARTVTLKVHLEPSRGQVPVALWDWSFLPSVIARMGANAIVEIAGAEPCTPEIERRLEHARRQPHG